MEALKRISIVFFLYSASFSLKAQILDDSTKSVYGPSTTRYIYEHQIKNDLIYYNPLDTNLYDFHRFSSLHKKWNFRQHLGNIGTPNTAVFYEVPEIIGVRSGFESFDIYFRQPDSIRYYDTKSPYSNFQFNIGESGRSVVDVIYSRNINERWNIGIDSRFLPIDKQFQRKTRGDQQVTSVQYDFFTRYFTANERYQVVANFSRLSHRHEEQGGLVMPKTKLVSDYLNMSRPSVYLNTAYSRELRINYHLYHQYKLTNLFQLYHELNKQIQVNYFNDDELPDTVGGIIPGTSPGIYYDTILNNKDLTNDRNHYDELTNELGVKGRYRGAYYRLYAKRREVYYERSDSANKNSVFENYLGYRLRYSFDRVRYIKADGEFNFSGNYRFSLTYNFFKFKFHLATFNYAPSFVQSNYAGNHDKWENNFAGIKTDHFKVSYYHNFKFISLEPKVSIYNVFDYIYFNKSGKPEQSKYGSRILSPSLSVNINFINRIYLKSEGIYTLVAGKEAEVFRIPAYFVNASIYYHNQFFGGKLDLMTGFDFHFRDSYYAYAYDLAIQQYKLQNYFLLPSYLSSDWFLNFGIGRARIFLKIVNISEAFGLDYYFASPQYPAQQQAIDLGINWMFFD